jgi:GTP pyrophosphokinase
MNTLDDLYAALGGGDIRLMQVVNYLQQLHAPPPEIDPRIKQRKPQAAKHKKDSIVVEGVGNLMSQIAGCCQPLPGEAILGYITQGRGVSAHRDDCDQLSNLLDQHPERQIDVNWSSDINAAFQPYMEVYCSDRDGILRDITTVLANERVGLLGVNSSSDTRLDSAKIRLTLEVKDLDSLSKTIARVQQLKGVSDVVRKDS